MKEVFVVTTGEYSDYRIVAVFDNRSLAENFIAPRQGKIPWMEIEVFKLNPEEIAIRRGWTVYRVKMRRDGSLEEDVDVAPEDLDEVGSKSLMGPYREGYSYLRSYVIAEDTQHSIKIVNEQRAQMIALGEWPEDGEPLPPLIGRIVPGFAEGLT